MAKRKKTVTKTPTPIPSEQNGDEGVVRIILPSKKDTVMQFVDDEGKILIEDSLLTLKLLFEEVMEDLQKKHQQMGSTPTTEDIYEAYQDRLEKSYEIKVDPLIAWAVADAVSKQFEIVKKKLKGEPMLHSILQDLTSTDLLTLKSLLTENVSPN